MSPTLWLHECQRDEFTQPYVISLTYSHTFWNVTYLVTRMDAKEQMSIVNYLTMTSMMYVISHTFHILLKYHIPCHLNKFLTANELSLLYSHDHPSVCDITYIFIYFWSRMWCMWICMWYHIHCVEQSQTIDLAHLLSGTHPSHRVCDIFEGMWNSMWYHIHWIGGTQTI